MDPFSHSHLFWIIEEHWNLKVWLYGYLWITWFRPCLHEYSLSFSYRYLWSFVNSPSFRRTSLIRLYARCLSFNISPVHWYIVLHQLLFSGVIYNTGLISAKDGTISLDTQYSPAQNDLSLWLVPVIILGSKYHTRHHTLMFWVNSLYSCAFRRTSLILLYARCLSFNISPVHWYS